MRYYETIYIVDPNLENTILEKTMTEIGQELEKTSVSEVAEDNDAQSPSDKNDNIIDVEKSLDPETTETNKEE